MKTRNLSVKIDCANEEVTIGGVTATSSLGEMLLSVAGILCLLTILIVAMLAVALLILKVPFGTEKWSVKSFVDICVLHFSPTTVLLFFLVVVCALILLLFIVSRFRISMARIHRDCERNQIDAAMGLIREILKVQPTSHGTGESHVNVKVEIGRAHV